MRFALRTLGAACALATASFATCGTEARAEITYPWCAISSISMGTQTCSFANLDQCRAYVASTGFCHPNARYTAPADARAARRGGSSR
jgi:hypothetical protein